MHETCLIIIHDPAMHETGPGIKPGTFGLADECSTTELTLLLGSQSSTGGQEGEGHHPGRVGTKLPPCSAYNDMNSKVCR